MSALTTALRRPGRRTIFQRTAGAVGRLPRPVAIAGAILLALIVVALTADVLRPLHDTTVDLDSVLQAPSGAHPMGTDEVGRDLLTRVIHGARVSLTIGFFAALLAAAVGGTLGLLAGTLGGKVDTLIMRFTDACASQSHFFFVLLIAVLFRPTLGGAGAVMLAVGLTHWPALARIVRGELLSLRERPFVAAAIGGGADRRRLARRHYVPHLVPAIGLAFVLTRPRLCSIAKGDTGAYSRSLGNAHVVLALVAACSSVGPARCWRCWPGRCRCLDGHRSFRAASTGGCVALRSAAVESSGR